MVNTLFKHRLQDVKQGFVTFPNKKDLIFAGSLFILYAIAAIFIGFSKGIFTFDLLYPEHPTHYLLPFSLVIFPCISEELFFRGFLLPHKNRQLKFKYYFIYSVVSVLLFVMWHPFNAFLFNNSAIPLFTDLSFLLIVLLLGIVCTVSYMQSGSLWIPILLHWLTVFVWVFFLGGRNKVLEIIK
jgi:predicted Abi (CAAX) family protease